MSEKPAAKESKVQVKTSKVSIAVFLATLVTVLIVLTSVVFPALLIRITSLWSYSDINPFEVGTWAASLIVTNLIILGLTTLYHKNKLPQKISKSIRFIFGFEVSKKTAFVVVLALLVIYVSATAGELASEEKWEDYPAVKKNVESWSLDNAKGFDVHVRYFLLSASLNIFDNIRVIPFIASIALLVLTYYVTLEISKKRFAGIVAMVIVLQSNVFLAYDTTATYDNFWILFYLLSLYFIYKKWYLSAITYLVSIPSKSLTAAFLPMTLFFIYRSKIPRKEKIRVAISYGIIVAILLVAISLLNVNLTFGSTGFNLDDIFKGFGSIAYQLRFDGLVLVFLLPLIFGLFIASKKGVLQADHIMVLIMGLLLSAPLLEGLTSQTNQPYRFVPLVVFFAMGVGILLSKRTTQA